MGIKGPIRTSPRVAFETLLNLLPLHLLILGEAKGAPPALCKEYQVEAWTWWTDQYFDREPGSTRGIDKLKSHIGDIVWEYRKELIVLAARNRLNLHCVLNSMHTIGILATITVRRLVKMEKDWKIYWDKKFVSYSNFVSEVNIKKIIEIETLLYEQLWLSLIMLRN